MSSHPTAPTHILALPDDIFTLVFANLTRIDDLWSVSRVCSKWRRVMNSSRGDEYWRAAYFSNIAASDRATKPPRITWREHCMRAFFARKRKRKLFYNKLAVRALLGAAPALMSSVLFLRYTLNLRIYHRAPTWVLATLSATAVLTAAVANATNEGRPPPRGRRVTPTSEKWRLLATDFPTPKHRQICLKINQFSSALLVMVSGIALGFMLTLTLKVLLIKLFRGLVALRSLIFRSTRVRAALQRVTPAVKRLTQPVREAAKRVRAVVSHAVGAVTPDAVGRLVNRISSRREVTAASGTVVAAAVSSTVSS